MTGRVSVLVLADAVDVQRALDAKRFERVAGDHQVVLAATDRQITARRAGQLRDFVRRGGGLVLLHSTLAAWSSLEPIRELAGWVPSGPGPVSELVLRANPDHPLTQDFDPEWRLTDELYFSEGPPADATVLLRTSWRYTEQVVAFERRYGEGRVVYLGLGHEPATFADPNFQKLLNRVLLLAAGRQQRTPMVAGLVGYGAIGREHAAAIAATPGLTLGAVADLSPERLRAATGEWSIRGYARQEQLFEDPDVDLVVVGTPPVAHSDSVLAALRAGKHVICEKPFALRVEEVDRMIDAAQSRGLTLTVYQSRRWDPDYVAMRDVVRSGRIGDVFYMESFIGGYGHPCDFWHSHEPISGGTIYDWGSHYFDWLLQLFGDRVTAVTAQAHKLVWHDVTNADQVRVDLTFSGGAQASFLQSDIASARKPKWYVLGTRGAIVGDWVDEPVPADFPARITVFRPADQGAHSETLSLPRREDHGFYRNLSGHFAWGDALAVHPEEARRNVAVMEAATQSIARGGSSIKVDI